MINSTNKKEIFSLFEKWGHIDEAGNICQNDCKYFKGSVLKKITDEDKDSSIEHYVLKFNNVLEFYEEIKKEYQNKGNKKLILEKIKKLLSFIPTANSIGDFETLIDDINNIKDAVESEFDKNFQEKEKICKEIQALMDDQDWQVPISKIKKIQEKFVLTGYVRAEKDELIKDRFRSLVDEYYQKRIQFNENKRILVEEQIKQREENFKKKEQLCREAEEMAILKGFNRTKEKIAELKNKWIEIGPVSINKAESISLRFRNACKKAL